ncbi:MAG: chemotaxis protein CheW [Thermodesulforhabdaceae bacterium]
MSELSGKHQRVAAYKGYKNGFADFYGYQIEVITGYTKDELKSIRWVDLIYEEDKTSAKEAFVKALKGNKVYVRDYRVRTKHGNLVWLREFSEIVMNELGDVDYVVGALMDITEEKKQEEIKKRHARFTGKYLIFRSAESTYGLSIGAVREVITAMPVTKVPEMPDFVEGVINLRGKVIPVISLVEFLGEEGKITALENSCIIIAETKAQEGRVLVGLHVDEVMGVLYIKGEEIEDVPQLVSCHCLNYALGIAKTDRGLVIILTVENLLGSDLAKISQTLVSNR